MYLIDSDTSIPVEAARPDPGPLQFFSEGNPGAGTPATTVEAWWLNVIQNELAYVVTQGGLAPDKADDTQVYQAILAIVAAASAAGHGQCVLDKVANDLVLSPFGGNKLVTDGSARTIADGGVALAGGLAADTTYNIYAYWDAGPEALKLEASATGHALSAGIRIKAGDATRSLVGKARTDAGGNWQGEAFTLSWFNRKPRAAVTVGGGYTTGSGTFAEMSSAMRRGFLTWDHALVMASASIKNSVDIYDGNIAIGIDGPVQHGQASIGNRQNDFHQVGQKALLSAHLGEGYHYATLLGSVGSPPGGTLTTQACFVHCQVMG